MMVYKMFMVSISMPVQTSSDCQNQRESSTKHHDQPTLFNQSHKSKTSEWHQIRIDYNEDVVLKVDVYAWFHLRVGFLAMLLILC